MSDFRWNSWVGPTLLLCIPAWAQVTQRVSVTSSGIQVMGDSFGSAITPDARYVGFSGDASDLAPGDSNNGAFDGFVRDRLNGTTEMVTLTPGGVSGNAGGMLVSLSADGRFASFWSLSFNLVPGDTNSASDVFVRDRQSGTTERVSVDSNGVQGNSTSAGGVLSPDGRFVLFSSIATNLVPGDTNGVSDAFLRDRQTGTTERVSLGATGAEGNGHSGGLAISPDGRFVVFSSDATNFVPGDSNGNADMFLRDRLLGTTELVSVATGGAQGNGDSQSAAITPDARFVAFASTSTNLVPGDTNNLRDVFVRDRQTGTTERVSVDSGGAQASGESDSPSISADGRYIAFTSLAADLVLADSNNAYDVFVHDRQTGVTRRISVSSAGDQGDDWSVEPRITPDGRIVVFSSLAGTLVPNEQFYLWDVFVRDRIGGTTFTSTCDPGTGGVIACPCGNPPAGSGRGCDNSSATGGASLSASGGALLSSDSLVFASSGEKPTATSILLQGTLSVPNGIFYGQGVRCLSGTIKRLYTKTASGGSITAPDFGAGDPQVSARSAMLGAAIPAGQSRLYLVFYRDPIVLGGCPATSTFNATQTGIVTWAP